MKVFLSYSHADQAFAHELRNSIEKLGVTVEDPDNAFGSGTAWAESIRGGLEQADVILLIVPEAGAKGANNAFFEAGAGHALGKLVLGVVPEPRNTRLRELPADLLGFAVMDASNKPLDAIAKTLVHAMEPA